MKNLQKRAKTMGFDLVPRDNIDVKSDAALSVC